MSANFHKWVILFSINGPDSPQTDKNFISGATYIL